MSVLTQVYPVYSGSATMTFYWLWRASRAVSWGATPSTLIPTLVISFPAGRDDQLTLATISSIVVEHARVHGYPMAMPGVPDALGRLHELLSDQAFPVGFTGNHIVRYFNEGSSTVYIG